MFALTINSITEYCNVFYLYKQFNCRIRSSPLMISTQYGNEIEKKTRQLNVVGTSFPPTTSMAGDQPNSRVKRRRRKFTWKLSTFSSCSKPCGGGKIIIFKL